MTERQAQHKSVLVEVPEFVRSEDKQWILDVLRAAWTARYGYGQREPDEKFLDYETRRRLAGRGDAEPSQRKRLIDRIERWLQL